MEAILIASSYSESNANGGREILRPMSLINGRPFLSYQLEYWVKQQVEKFVISVNPRTESVRDYFGNRFRGIELDYVVEKRNMGTGGSLLLCQQRVSGENFLVLSPEQFVEVSAEELMAFHEKQGADVTMVVTPPRKGEMALRVETQKEGRVTALHQSQSDINATGLMSTGTYLFSKSAMEGLNYERGDQFDLEKSLLPQLAQKGDAFYTYQTNSTLIDIGNSHHLKLAADVFVALSEKAA